MTNTRLGLNQPRDNDPRYEADLLIYLWRWKVAPTAALVSACFPTVHLQTAYKKLLALHVGGYIESRWNLRADAHLWTLSEKGFRAILPLLPTLIEQGFRAEAVCHDYLTSMLQAGDPCCSESDQIQTVTEQEMRRCDRDILPTWLPDIAEHRPDGVWCIDDGEPRRLIALEVQNSIQSRHVFADTFYWYDLNRDFDFVIWLASTPAICKSLRKAVRGSAISSGERHFFCTYEDYLQSQSDTVLFNTAGASRSLGCFFRLGGRKIVEKSQKTFSKNHYLDLSKSALRTVRYASLAQLRSFI